MRALLAPALVAGMAAALVCWSLALRAGATASSAQPAPLLVSVVDGDSAARRTHAAALAEQLAGWPGARVRFVPDAEVARTVEALPPSSLAAMPLPELLEVDVATPAVASRLLVQLAHRPNLLVMRLRQDSGAVGPVARWGALLLLGLALLAAGVSGHVALRPAPLRLLRRLGAAPRQLLLEALGPGALAGLTGAAVGDLLATILLVSRPGAPVTAAMLATVPLILGAVLLGGLVSAQWLLSDGR